ncbi:30-kDa cleavage and polyadenylation specificity factor 30 [Gossypium australe]|uniref:30-kDa cleavage and polyadenylation specificity factor 30 n=1 Tax=Gossypium australe TaxID=47621 RepID=A0A5B6US99_9ROSI|nr:30-kDa cleavage and polyadenylation specificity factor 30 [Gossypium australe]
MDDAEGGLSFDFEGGLDAGPPAPTASMPVVNSDPSAANNTNNFTAPGGVQASINDPVANQGGGAGRRSFRQTVCRHWLRSLCMKGDACGFLHQYDKSRMPVCRFFRLFGECREQDCVYKHTNEDIKECNMYKLGFCPNGPDCRYRHAKLPGPPPPVEEVLQKIQQLSVFRVLGYFIVKSCNRENLELSVQQGVWATQRSNEAKLNEAFDSAENVILVFSVNRTRHFQGCAKMTSKIGGSVAGGNWKYAHGTAHYGRNFSISRDCQELEPSVGEQLASLLYLEPDSELMAISLAAESKREEEKAKGVKSDNAENPDIVPFEDNEEEEEEESEEEDESFGAAAQGRGRGRGIMWPPHMPLARGARPMPGMRGFPPMMMGGDGFSYGPVTADGFGMPDLFGAPRPFAPYGPRFSGDFTGPASGMMFPGRPPQPGGMFPSGGIGMMMGPGRAPFMGGMGPTGNNPARGGRPVGMPPMFPLPPAPASQNSGRAIKRDQRTPTNDRSSAGSEQGRGQEMGGPGGGLEDETQYQQEGQKAHHEDQLAAGNSFRNDDSESEDEAPRRSRHGEGKKKRRGLEGDVATASDH